MIRNPILPGFNPDPSICRVGDDYYIATSTFEWYPGVQIHHSRDLVNWNLVSRPLDRAAQLDMRGNPDSCGIWAPCLSYADGLFWLVYTDVKRYDGNFKDTHNYIVTAPAITGPWSDPIYVNSSGFDPSLFHDDDGRKWFVNMLWNYRTESVGGKPEAAPPSTASCCRSGTRTPARLKGPVKNIFRGTPLGLVEGPHLYKRNGWYYLTTAEGGTAYDHAVTMARSRSIDGPYEMHPPSPDHLEGRARCAAAARGPRPDRRDARRRSSITRTSAAGRCRARAARRSGARPRSRNASGSDDDWLYLEHGGVVPRVEVPAPRRRRPTARARAPAIRFDGAELPMEFQWLRTPYPERLFTLTGDGAAPARPRVDRQLVRAGLVARRQEDFRFRAETRSSPSPPTPTSRSRASPTTTTASSSTSSPSLARDARARAHDDVVPRRLSRWPPRPSRSTRRSRSRTARRARRRGGRAPTCSSSTTPATAGSRSARCSTRA